MNLKIMKRWTSLSSQGLRFTTPMRISFFVHKDDELLAQDIEIGFKKLIATGQYEVMFQKAYGDLLNKANLENRQLMSLSNGFFRKPDDKEKKYYFNL